VAITVVLLGWVHFEWLNHPCLPSGNDCYIAIENAIEIVDLPIKDGDFPVRYVNG
jgi:hypothetical protein